MGPLQGYVIALAVLVVLGVAAWRAYDWWETKKAAEAGAAFEAAITLGDQGKHAEAEAAFSKIAQDSATNYRTLALMRAAAELAQTDPKAAVAAYDKIAANASVGADLRDLGRAAGRLAADRQRRLRRGHASGSSRWPVPTTPSGIPRANCSRSRPGAPTIPPPPSAGSR